MEKRYGFVRCGISTLGSNVGDIDRNVEEIIKTVRKAEEESVDLLVFPELCITGYTMQDMFFDTNVEVASLKALEKIRYDTKICKCNTIFIVGMPLRVNSILYNVAVVMQKGEILGVVPKTYIPNQNEFYEKRYFTPYNGKEKIIKKLGLGHALAFDVPFGYIVFDVDFKTGQGYSFGVEICEDLWSVKPPSLDLALSGANIITNLSASNELLGKDDYRKELVKTQSARTHSAYVYTSAGLNESTTDTVFGGSGYIFENGKELLTAKRYHWDTTLYYKDVDVEFLNFERIKNKTFADCASKTVSDVQHVYIDNWVNSELVGDLKRDINPHPFVPKNNPKACKEIFDIQTYGLAKRLKSINLDKVTIGVSGGLDSTLALLVTANAFEILEYDKCGILGITMPGFGTSDRTYQNSLKLSEALGITLEEISIKDACIQHFKDIGHNINNHNLVYENSQARERTQILMDKGFTIGTGDLSEGALGWCTYNADHMSMYNVNASIPKTLVKHLINWYANENPKYKEILFDIVETPISPELLPPDENGNIAQKTESNVGAYEVQDFFLYHFLRRGTSGEKLIFLANTAFDGIYTEEQIKEWYDIFFTRFFNNQFKRDCVPAGPKVGSVALSPRGDLRMSADMTSKIWKI